jgi:hypothetical protein
MQQAEDHLDRSGLTRPVRPEESEDFAASDINIDMIDSDNAIAQPKVLKDLGKADAFDDQIGRRGCGSVRHGIKKALRCCAGVLLVNLELLLFFLTTDFRIAVGSDINLSIGVERFDIAGEDGFACPLPES